MRENFARKPAGGDRHQLKGIYSATVKEYPPEEGVPTSERVANWGKLNADNLSLNEIAINASMASEIMDNLQVNLGPQS